jgi:hypothetical protein
MATAESQAQKASSFHNISSYCCKIKQRQVITFTKAFLHYSLQLYLGMSMSIPIGTKINQIFGEKCVTCLCLILQQ